MGVIRTRTDGGGRRWTQPAKRLAAIVTVATAAVVGAGSVIEFSSGPDYNAVDNSNNSSALYDYNEFVDMPQTELDELTGGEPAASETFTVAAGRPDNGPQPNQGQFRLNCDVSHYGRDDPIIKPNQPGTSHLHMFFGNTRTSSETKFNGVPGIAGDHNDIMNSGGSTCQGNVLNRSAYWIPAMYSGGEGEGRKIVMPTNILLYYKSYRPQKVQPLPPGVELVAGNINPGGSVNATFSPTDQLKWECYNPNTGLGEKVSGVIPTNCPADQPIRAVIAFPQCLATDDGTITGKPVISASDYLSHTRLINNNSECPPTHPYRMPQISYIITWENMGADEVSKWRLSCDQNLATGKASNPGGCLHGDWLGGWNPAAIQTWINGCFDPDTNPAGGLFTNTGTNNFAGPRNCSIGQLGRNGNYQQTGQARDFKRFSPLLNTTRDGLVDDPCPTCPAVIVP